MRIPKMGMTTIDVDLVEWKVSPGDEVEIGQPLAVIESEKVEMTLDAEVAGVVYELLAEEGVTLEVGDIICRIQEKT